VRHDHGRSRAGCGGGAAEVSARRAPQSPAGRSPLTAALPSPDGPRRPTTAPAVVVTLKRAPVSLDSNRQRRRGEQQLAVTCQMGAGDAAPWATAPARLRPAGSGTGAAKSRTGVIEVTLAEPTDRDPCLRVYLCCVPSRAAWRGPHDHDTTPRTHQPSGGHPAAQPLLCRGPVVWCLSLV
jgi:hypothetical protein